MDTSKALQIPLKTLSEASLARKAERDLLIKTLSSQNDKSTKADYMIQLISALSLPLENMENPKARLYPEDHRSESAIKQDELMPYIRKWFEDHSYCPKNLDGKQAKRFRSLVNRFI